MFDTFECSFRKTSYFSPSPWLKESLTISRICAEYMKFCDNVKKRQLHKAKDRSGSQKANMTWTAVQIYEYWSMFGVEMTVVLASKSRVSWSHTLIPTGTDKTGSAVGVGLVQLIKHSTLYILCHLLWLSCESWSSRMSFKIFKVPGNELWCEYISSVFSVSGCEIYFSFFQN